VNLRQLIVPSHITRMMVVSILLVSILYLHATTIKASCVSHVHSVDVVRIDQHSLEFTTITTSAQGSSSSNNLEPRCRSLEDGEH
jgi:hypothetical protein